jgi:hypothetical protein
MLHMVAKATSLCAKKVLTYRGPDGASSARMILKVKFTSSACSTLFNSSLDNWVEPIFPAFGDPGALSLEVSPKLYIYPIA